MSTEQILAGEYSRRWCEKILSLVPSGESVVYYVPVSPADLPSFAPGVAVETPVPFNFFCRFPILLSPLCPDLPNLALRMAQASDSMTRTDLQRFPLPPILMLLINSVGHPTLLNQVRSLPT